METTTIKTKVHFTDTNLLQPTNPITINLIGAGGTGSQVLTSLARMNYAMNELNHAGFEVRLWDDDSVTTANLGRQLFAESELNMYKSVALINRVNRFFGTNWKAETMKFEKDILEYEDTLQKAQTIITISCVDNVKTRFEIAEILETLDRNYYSYNHNTPKYWLDFGNSQHIGQVILSTIGKITQPSSKKYECIAHLPFITEQYGDLLKQSEQNDDTPSCSLSDALEKQDLYINSTLAQMGTSLLWNMFRQGFTQYKGFFLNLKNFRSQPIMI